MGEYEYKIITSKDNNDLFCKSMCKFFSSKECISELDGYPIYDHEGCVWFVCYHNSVSVGFSGLDTSKNKKIILKEDYVLSDFRNNGIYSELFSMRERYIQDLNIKCIITGIANNNSKNMFIKHGYTLKRQTKRFFFFEKGMK